MNDKAQHIRSERHPKRSNWLEEFLRFAVKSRFCFRVCCTTCGARQFRNGLASKGEVTSQTEMIRMMPRGAVEIIERLAEIEPSLDDLNSASVEATRFALFEAWANLGESDFEKCAMDLNHTWAGTVLDAMREHTRRHHEAARVHAERNDPVKARQRREEKQRQRQIEHAKRIADQKERSKQWHAADRNQDNRSHGGDEP